MNSTGERLSDLLAQRARQGSGVQPSLAGVHNAVGRRRTRRHRVIGSAAAGLLVVACLGAAVATRTEGDTEVVAAPDAGALPDVPAVGLAVDGFVQDEPQIGDLHLGEEPARTVVVFRSGRSLADPFVTVAVLPPSDGVPPEAYDPSVDLDGDGVDDVSRFGSHLGSGAEWRLTDGSVAVVGADLVDAESEEAFITYAREVFSPTLDLDDLPSPAGLPERDTWTLPDPRGPDEARVRYEADDGSGRWITISTTNQPGYFDLLQDSSANPADGYGYEEIALGPSFLGSGRAIVFDSYSGPGRDYALIRTDTGLTLEITTGCHSGQVCTRPALDAGTIRDVIRTGAFVDVEPTEGPPTTTALAPATTTPVTSTSILPVADLEPLPTLTRTIDDGGEHIRFAFDDFQPSVGTLTILETLNPTCDRFAADYERTYRAYRAEPFWQGWMTIELGARFAADPTAVFVPGEFPYILCNHTADTTIFAFPIANLGEPTVTPLSGLPEILIDIPR